MRIAGSIRKKFNVTEPFQVVIIQHGLKNLCQVFPFYGSNNFNKLEELWTVQFKGIAT
jgi:hypothetical protein